MDSLTDDKNTWFNAVRLEDSQNYSSAAIAYLEDGSHSLDKNLYVRAAMSSTCAAFCLATVGDIEDSIELFSVAASLYEYSADVGMSRSIRESLWSLLHAFEYYTIVSDHVSAERASKKYADLARRVDRFETRVVFDALKNRRENVLVARDDLGLSMANSIETRDIPEMNKIQRSVRSFLIAVQSIIQSSPDSGEIREEDLTPDDEDSLLYESESNFNERRIVS
jgi:hypothetical protein